MSITRATNRRPRGASAMPCGRGAGSIAYGYPAGQPGGALCDPGCPGWPGCPVWPACPCGGAHPAGGHACGGQPGGGPPCGGQPGGGPPWVPGGWDPGGQVGGAPGAWPAGSHVGAGGCQPGWVSVPPPFVPFP